jgi:CO/xanthine dehydrogenase Mo-binding subunit
MSRAVHTRPDPTLVGSWLQIRPDNTVLIRTGVGDFGTGAVGTAFRQIVAEELRLPFEAVSEVVSGDTSLTPDGGMAAGVMGKGAHAWFYGAHTLHPGSPFGRSALNLQKVAAFAYQALLERASAELGAPVSSLTAEDGVIRSGSASVTYAELVPDDLLDVHLELGGAAELDGIVVLGTPPVVSPSDYRVIGTSCPNPRTREIAQGTALFAGDIKLTGMLHCRVVHPPTFGSKLASVGQLDATVYPGAEVIVVKNLVGVVSEDEWEAIRAAQALAATTVWSEWNGLPQSDRLAEALLDLHWSPGPSKPSADSEADAVAALEAAPRTLTSYFSLPYYKHALISPEVAVADAPPDGEVQIWSCSQNPQALRGKIATMLQTDLEHVVIHHVPNAASFGRTNLGDGGPEAEAVLLSRACGRPVRVQWTREDDFGWTNQQACYLGEISVGLDEAGKMTAFTAEHHQPGSNQESLLGALLVESRIPTTPPGVLSQPGHCHLDVAYTEWPYDSVTHRHERAYGAPNIGEAQSPLRLGLRHRSMRSPNHLQQNFGVESMVNEAAAAAGADPIQYRLDQTTDERLIAVLEAVRRRSGWESRPSPSPAARSTGGGVVRGRGVGVAIRHGAWLAGVAEISVDLESGVVAVERYWVAVDCGLVVNPTMLRLNVEGGSMMGISMALHEEVQFNGSAITSTDFLTYPILTMAQTPEIDVEIIDRRDVMEAGPGSEPPNMVPPVALTGALFDATGKYMRRLPMRPGYVLAELRDG